MKRILVEGQLLRTKCLIRDFCILKKLNFGEKSICETTFFEDGLPWKIESPDSLDTLDSLDTQDSLDSLDTLDTIKIIRLVFYNHIQNRKLLIQLWTRIKHVNPVGKVPVCSAGGSGSSPCRTFTQGLKIIEGKVLPLL